MKKGKKTNLRNEIVALITSYVNKGDYQILLAEYAYGADNYCDGSVIIGGMRIGCAFHKQDYICWFGDINGILRDNDVLNDKLCNEAKKLIAEHQEEVKEQRIKQLEKELKELKGE